MGDMSSLKGEKKSVQISELPNDIESESSVTAGVAVHNDDGVFKEGEGGYRTVGWLKASAIFLKIIFALGVLSIPGTLNTLGAIGGGIIVVGWGVLVTWLSVVMGDFRQNHPEVHNIADAGYIIGGPRFGHFLRETFGFIFIASWVLLAGAGMIGVSTALNALSLHGLCTVGFTGVAAIVTALFASIQTFGKIGILTWVGLVSIVSALLIVVIAVTQTGRPAAAPTVGEYTLGFVAVGYPTFVNAMSAVSTIFVSYGGASAFIPVIAEMRNPKDYRKSLLLAMTFVISAYLSLSMVVYAYVGQYVASPALGSAGALVKRIAYGIALPGLWVTCILYLHLAAKYLFVRILRGSIHLQKNSTIHWITWLSCTVGLSTLAFIVASAIPFFSLLLGLIGALFLAPSTLVMPCMMWFHDNPRAWTGPPTKKMWFAFYTLVALIGSFLTVAGTYSSIVGIKDAFLFGTVGSAFSCADNSGSVAV